MTKRVLLTGAGGFAGAHMLRHLLMETDWDIVCPVTFRHRGNSDRIASSLREGQPGWHDRVNVVMHDLAAPLVPLADRVGKCDHVIALAAESHVDRSIEDPVSFVRNNVDVVLTTLEYARRAEPESVIIFSTDEVYGPMLGDMPHAEWAPVIPSNPYSASKACQEAAAIAYWRTYGVPVVIVNSMNLVGEMQDPEKFLPKVIRHVLAGQPVPIHGVPGNIGSRYFIHARAVAGALLHILTELPVPVLFPAADRPDRWNIVGDQRLTNLELAQMVAAVIGKPLKYELIDFHASRPGHDPHYGLDGAKLAAAGWKSAVEFGAALEKAVRWTLIHPEWLNGD